jgi:hypothetical protein
MRTIRTKVLPGESAAIHAKLDAIIRGGDPVEILLVVCLLLDLRPLSRHKATKKKRQPARLPLKTQTRTGRASERIAV